MLACPHKGPAATLGQAIAAGLKCSPATVLREGERRREEGREIERVREKGRMREEREEQQLGGKRKREKVEGRKEWKEGKGREGV